MLALLLPAFVMRLRWARCLAVLAPLAGGMLLLLATNIAGHGRIALSPHGSSFLLARLVADGPAARTIAARCPEAGWYLCDFAGRLPEDADVFLWAPDSPVNRTPEGIPIFLGGMLLAPEARIIVAETLWREPLSVLQAGLGNAWRQLLTAGIGDTLGNRHLDVAVRPRIAQGFPPSEVAGFDAALQRGAGLAQAGRAIAWLHPLVLLASLPLLAWGWWRGDARLRGLLLALVVAVLANALATGALSGVHARYQARIAWLLPLLVGVALAAPRRAPGCSCLGARGWSLSRVVQRKSSWLSKFSRYSCRPLRGVGSPSLPSTSFSRLSKLALPFSISRPKSVSNEP
jgi:hypothetical protein